MATVENITSELRRIQAQQLTRLDVATVVVHILGLVLALIGTTAAAIKLVIDLLK